MDVDPSLQISYQIKYRTNQAREQTQAQNREPEGTVNQPANKVSRLNNINEDHLLDQTPKGECHL